MSTIKVTNINNASASSGGIAFDSSGHVQVDGVQMPTAGPLSNRNLIINGAMQVSQRSTSTSFPTSTDGFVVDRFHNLVGHGVFTVSQSTDAPSGLANSLKWDCTTSASSGSSGETFVEQLIEAQNLQNLAYGTSSAKSFTLSFWVKSNLTGNFGLWIENADATRYYASAGYTINSANTWEYKTITVPGDTAGTGINNDNGVGFKLRFYLVANSIMQGTPAESWETSPTIRVSSSMVNLASSTDNEFFLTGVQLEVGEKATPFEHRSFGDELARCQRYYEAYYLQSYAFVGNSYSSTQAIVPLRWNVQKRAVPTMTLPPVGINSGEVALTASNASYATTRGTHTLIGRSPSYGELSANSYGGLTSGGICMLYAAGTTCFLTLDAEL